MSSRDFWEGRYRTANAEGSSLWGTAPNGWIAEQTADLTPGHAIDLGAGEGRNAAWLVARGWTVEAVDFAEAAVEGMRARGLRAVVGDVTSWASDEPADLAVLCYLQLPPDALAAAIDAAARCLRPGGVLLGIWHDREDAARGLAGTMDPRIRTTPTETAAAARAAGLVVDRSGRRDRAVEAGLACDCLLVAHRD